MIKNLSLFIRKNLRLIIGIAVVFAILYTQTPLGKREEESQEIQTAEKKQVLQSFSASGTIESKNKTILHFQTIGKVVWAGVEKGDSVYVGQALASLDITELQASWRQAEQDFVAAKAEVEKVYDETGRKTDESFSEKIKRTAAEAKQNKAFDQMKKIEKQIQDATLVSPINGAVTDISIRRGENVGITETIEIIDSSSFYFRAEVDETDYSRVFVGQKVKIMLEAYKGKIFNGKVSFIGGKTEVASSGISFVPVEIDLEEDPSTGSGQGKKIIDRLSGEVEFIENKK